MAFDWDEVASQVSGNPDPASPAPAPQAPPSDLTTAPPPAPAPKPAAAPADWDSVAGGMADEADQQLRADAAAIRYRDQHFARDPGKAAQVLRAYGATGWDPEYLSANWDKLEPQLAPLLQTQVDWEKVARKHPALFGVVQDPVKGPVIREATADLTGLSWAVTGRWETASEPVTVEDQIAALEAGQPAPELGTQQTVGRQVVPSGPQAALAKGEAQQEYVRSTTAAMMGDDSAARRAREAGLQERLASDIGAHGLLERGFTAPAEMAPYLAGRLAAGQAGRLVTGAIGGVLGGLAGSVVPVAGSVAGAAEGFAFGYGVLGHASDFMAGASWDTYQNAGPLFRQLQALRDQEGNRIVDDDQARRYALAGSALTGVVTAGLGGKVLEAIPGVKELLGRAAGGAMSQALTRATVPQALKSLALSGGEHLAAGALMMGVQQGGSAATLEAAAAANSAADFDWARVGRATLDGIETGVRDMWMLSFWAPGKAFVGDMGEAWVSRQGADRLVRAADALEAAKGKLPEVAGDQVVEELVANLAQEKGAARQVYIRREAWDAAWTKQGVDPAQAAAEILGDGGKGYAETALTGGDLVIPMSRASKALLRAKGAIELVRNDARVAQDQLSNRELLAASAARVQRMRELASTPDHVKAKEEVFNLVRLQAERAGEPAQRARDAARLVAEFVGNMAARLGVPVGEAAAFTGLARLRILGPEQTQLSTLSQERVLAALPEFFQRLTPASQDRIRLAIRGVEDARQRDAILWAFERAYRDDKGSGAPNSLAWHEHVMLHDGQGGTHFAVDANDLKFFNDVFGHDTGSEMLFRIARSLQAAADAHSGFYARTGGDEFKALFPTREAAARAREVFLAELAKDGPTKTLADVEQLPPDLAAKARASLGPGQVDFRPSVRLGIGPTATLADAGEQLARMERIKDFGDIREAGTKVISGHGRSYVHDAYDPSSPHYQAALAAAGREATKETGVPVAVLEQARPVTETPAFKAWFGESKVVDEHGAPLVVFHGTPSEGGAFDAFDLQQMETSGAGGAGTTDGFFFTSSEANAKSYSAQHGKLGRVMQLYLRMENPLVLDYEGDMRAALKKDAEYLDLTPEDIDGMSYEEVMSRAAPDGAGVLGDWIEKAVREAKRKGHDGLILRNIVDNNRVSSRLAREIGPGLDDPATHYVVFEPTQIKSATGNAGTFDPANPSMLHSSSVAMKAGPHGGIAFVLDDGSGKPLEATIHLADANAGTLAHELSHFFVEALSRMATRGELTDPGLRGDYDALVRFMGYQDHAGRLADAPERVRLAAREGKAVKAGGLDAGEQRRLQELRAREERVSYAFEQFLSEGKPPSTALAGVFRRFSRWLGRLYQGAETVAGKYRQLYGEELVVSDDVRGIFRRLLASQTEIDRAQAADEMQPFRPALEQLTPEERTRWEELDARDRTEAEARVIRSLVEDDRKRIRATAEAERSRVRAQVEAEIDANPTHQAVAYLTTGALVAGAELPAALTDANGQPWKLDRKALVKAYGADFVRQLPQEGLTDKNGLSAEELASQLGFTSGDQLVRAVAAAEPRAKAVQREVARRVLEKLGPALIDDPMRLQEAAAGAARTEAATEKLLLERRALARQLDPSLAPRGPELDREFLRAQAHRILEVKPLGELSPGYYLDAERRAARQMFELAARAAGEADGAKKQRWLAKAHDLTEIRLLNRELYRAALELREKMDAAYERLGKTGETAWRAQLGKAAPAYRDTNDAILAAIGLPRADSAPRTPAEAAKALEDMLRQADADAATIDFDVGAIRELVTSPRRWTELTVEEARNVVDAVKNIRRAANLANEVVLLDKRLTKDDVLEQMARASSVLPAKPKGKRDRATEGTGATLRRGLQGVLASLVSIETASEMLSGLKKDSIFHKVFVDGYLEARNREDALARDYGKVIADAWEKMPAPVRRRLHDLVDLSKDLPLPAELKESAWQEDSAVTRSYLLMVALNMGNAGNKQRLLDGYGWNEAQVLGALGEHLTRAELDFAQGVWNSLEGLYPQIEALHERDSGLKPGKVPRTPLEVRLADGTTWRGDGGYFPAKYDPRRGMSQRGFVAQERDIAGILDPQSRYPGTPKGHTKERAAAVTDVINLDWSVIPTHVSQVLHDLAFREYVRQTAAIVVDPRFETIVSRGLGPEYARQFRPWLQDLASNRADAVRADIRSTFALLSWGKGRTMMAAMGHNFANALGDLANPLVASLGGYVRPDYLARATSRLTPGLPGATSSREAWDFAVASSSELQHRRDRAAEHLRRHLDEMAGDASKPNALQRSALTRPAGDLLAAAKDTAFWAQETIDKLTSAQVWLGAYLQHQDVALKGGRPDPHGFAVREADAVVRKLFPAESAAERPAIMRARALAPMLMFYGYFSKIHQMRRLAAFEAKLTLLDAEASPGEKAVGLGKLAGRVLGVSVALAISDLYSGRGPEQQNDSWAAWLGRKLAAAQTLDLPLVGPLLSALSEKTLGGRGQVSVRAAPALALGETVVRKLGKMLDEGAAPDEAFWSAIGLGGIGLGAPTLGVVRPGSYVTSGAAEEDVGAGRPEDVAAGLLYGERPGQALNPITAVRATLDGSVPLVKP